MRKVACCIAKHNLLFPKRSCLAMRTLLRFIVAIIVLF